jgi:hypothetical protein
MAQQLKLKVGIGNKPGTLKGVTVIEGVIKQKSKD